MIAAAVETEAVVVLSSQDEVVISVADPSLVKAEVVSQHPVSLVCATRAQHMARTVPQSDYHALALAFVLVAQTDFVLVMMPVSESGERQ